MSLNINSWDKLTKAQHDYPKPKFSIAVVDKSLKKYPSNAYLLAWRTDLWLQQCHPPEHIIICMLDLHKMAILDTQLLSYMYKVFIEATRRKSQILEQYTIGTNARSCWQAAAKTFRHKDDRMSLWSDLFKVALQENVWDDVRFAILKYKAEGPPEKKGLLHSQILSTLLASHQMEGLSTELDLSASIQSNLAVKLMLKAYEASPDDPTAIKDITDLRFMVYIFGQAGQYKELKDRLYNPPEHLRNAVLYQHREDISDMIARHLKCGKHWRELEQHCYDILVDTHSRSKLKELNSESDLRELCAWRCNTWTDLLMCLDTNHSEAKANEIASSLMKLFFGDSKPKYRQIHILQIHVRSYLGENSLSDCQEFFKNHCRMVSCFNDVRKYVELLDVADIKRFMASSTNYVIQQSSDISTATEGDSSLWLPSINIAKFEYLFYVSQAENPSRYTIEGQFLSNIKLWAVSKDADSGYLAVYLLLNLHHRYICPSEDRNPLEFTRNSRILLQAAMLARHLVEQDEDKENRTFALFAARLHLNLGLGLAAFRLYKRITCKEMLLETLSPFILSRISQTHPFDVSSYRGFSADDELAKTMSTIERMEAKTSSFLVTDLTFFPCHQAPEIAHLKSQLNRSLTKHLCSLERRGIARLRGEPSDHIPRLDWKTYDQIHDNVDQDIFPNFETSREPARAISFIMPNPIPEALWIRETCITREHTSQRLYNEAPYYQAQLHPYEREPGETHNQAQDYLTRVEQRMGRYWRLLAAFVSDIQVPDKPTFKDTCDYLKFFHLLGQLRKALEKLRMPGNGNTTLKPEDEPTMFHENMLMACFQQLELLRATNKFVEQLKEHVIKVKGGKTHPLKKSLPSKYDTHLLQETQVCYQAVRDVAQSYIDLILKRGTEAIKAQVRWGPTGEAMKMIMTDEDVEYYAQEYVESALEAWRGVLKVKLK